MAKFSCAVVVHREDGTPVWFLPGQDVPEWAFARIGEHVYAGELSTPTVAAVEVEDASDPAEEVEVDPSGVDGVSESGDTEAVSAVESDTSPASKSAEPSTEPDFTKPAPAKRGRPRKTQG